MTDYYKDMDHIYVPRQKYGPRFTAAEVRAYRDENSVGMMEAKEHLMRQQILGDLARGRCGLETGLLYDILEYMVENRV